MQPPFHVFFFRPSTANSIVGVSLLINIPGVHNLGIEGFQIEHFAECTLHTLDLGVAQYYPWRVLMGMHATMVRKTHEDPNENKSQKKVKLAPADA